ncbi:hypothetical protein EPO15_18530 [bacterium]|nr:MAG: hypothetical protein EPO15_18530 [bacterium]
MDKKTLAVLAAAFAGLLTLVLLTGGGAERLSAEPVVLASAGGESVTWSSCPAAKCLTVYVAPWCGVCRASTGFLKAFAEAMERAGVPSRVVVGRGEPAAVADYAKAFGPRALLDPEGKVPLAGGVPQFIVTAADGAVLKRQPGVPRIIEPPIPEADIREVAAFLGLP